MSEAVINDRYRIVRRLGQGGMSRVYLCWDDRLQVWCAIKVMAAEAVDDPILRARFVQEARTLARLGHQNLVRLFDLVDDTTCPYMVMEYCEGGSLAARLSRGPMALRDAVRLAAELAAALQAAHAAGVVHRDVKPQNLLLDASGTLKVVDFGVARVQQELRLTLSNMSLGTLAYMPPEQQRDASKVDHRADIYGAGATLFALSTARRPTALLTQDRESALALVPTEIRPIVRRATEPSRSNRYESAATLEEALRAALARIPEDPAAPRLVDRTEPPPEGPPDRAAELVLEPNELEGTGEKWSAAGTRPLDSTMPLPSFQAIDPSRDSVPAPTALMMLPRPRRWVWVRRAATVVIALSLGIACGGGCVCAAIVGLGGTVWAWPR
jgi:serine/threonine-protein kinase